MWRRGKGWLLGTNQRDNMFPRKMSQSSANLSERLAVEPGAETALSLPVFASVSFTQVPSASVS